MLGTIQPHVIKIDASDIASEEKALKLVSDAHALGIVVIFKRLESISVFKSLSRLAASSQLSTYAQGHLWDMPTASLNQAAPKSAGMEPAAGSSYIDAG